MKNAATVTKELEHRIRQPQRSETTLRKLADIDRRVIRLEAKMSIMLCLQLAIAGGILSLLTR